MHPYAGALTAVGAIDAPEDWFREDSRLSRIALTARLMPPRTYESKGSQSARGSSPTRSIGPPQRLVQAYGAITAQGARQGVQYRSFRLRNTTRAIEAPHHVSSVGPAQSTYGLGPRRERRLPGMGAAALPHRQDPPFLVEEQIFILVDEKLFGLSHKQIRARLSLQNLD